MSPSTATAQPAARASVWYRDVTPDQWKALLAAYLGWVLDAFDFTILTFLLADIQRSFTVNRALAGALGTVTLAFRVVGGIGAGTAADRYGRKAPLVFSILWYSVFAFAGGFSTSYLMLFIIRALFGIGMGGVWAAGVPLALEQWPGRFRGIASGMLQSGYSTGFMLSALVYSSVYPIVNRGDFGWRVLMWIGILPAFLVLWIVAHVKESPVWLERRQSVGPGSTREGLSARRLLDRDLLPITIQTSILVGAFMFFYYSITFWYPTFLSQIGRSTLPFLVALNLGTALGNLVWGRVSETEYGRRGAATIATAGGILAIPFFLFASATWLLLAGAFVMGLFGCGNFGVIPTYLSERFPTAVRGAGAGLAYHVGAALGSITPYMIGALQDRGMPLANAMAWSTAVAGALVIVALRLGPETRGRALRSGGDA